MPVIKLEMLVRAPIQVCFDLARDIDLHMRSTAKSKEVAVAGVTSGLIGANEEVTWEATHFFIRQKLTSRITIFEPPHHFRDSQIRGAFRRFHHDHFFTAVNGTNTRLADVFDYESPLGWLGKLADRLFLERYMRRFLQDRNALIKAVAESEISATGSYH